MNNTEETGGLMPRSVAEMVSKYNYMMVELRDPRADAWPLMSSVWPTVAICVGYVYFVKVLGPR